MGDASNVATNQHISRSGRILKKPFKLKECEESHSDEASIQEKLCKASKVAKKKHFISSRRQKSTRSKKLLFKKSVVTSKAIRKNTVKASRISSLGSCSEVTHERASVVPPIKITKISRDESAGVDPTYSVAPSSSKMLDASYSVSHSLDSTEESSSDSTAASSEFSGRDASVSGHLGHSSVVSNDSSESMSDEESSDDSSSIHQLSNSDEEHDEERDNNTEAATNGESSDDSSSIHQLSNSDEDHDADRSDKTEAVTSEGSEYIQSVGCGRSDFSDNDEMKSAARKRKYPIVYNENTAVVANRKKSKNKITSFMLWSEENGPKISAQFAHLSRKELSKKVAQTWKALDQREKVLWIRKAKQRTLKSTTAQYLKSKQNTENAVETLNDIFESSAGDSSLETYPKLKILGTAPIDTAAHLALLGSSLTNIGLKIAELEYEPSKTGVYSALLDSLLCAIGPLMCLTREIAGLEHLPNDNFQKTLDHIAYFFPGL